MFRPIGRGKLLGRVYNFVDINADQGIKILKFIILVKKLRGTRVQRNWGDPEKD